MKFSQKAVAALLPGPRKMLWDDTLPGLGIRITEGSVAYVVDFRVSGKRRRVVIGPTTVMKLEAARDRAAEIVLGARRGMDLTEVARREERPTFRGIWTRMLDEVDRPRLSPATISDYEDRANRLILPRIGDKAIADVSEADVDRIVAAITGERNRAYAVALIRKTVNFAVRDRKLPADHRNPAIGAKVRKVKSTVARALEVEEIARFGSALAAMEARGAVSPWLANLFRLALICGLRPGEVRTLKWEAVNLPRAKMVVTGKTGSREVHLTEAAIEVLMATPRVQGCEYVFAGRRFGEPLVGLHKMLRAVQDEAKVERFRPYDLRHSAATGALASGADVRAVQALLGHADLQTTAGYLHASPERRKAAAERASAFGRGVLKKI